MLGVTRAEEAEADCRRRVTGLLDEAEVQVPLNVHEQYDVSHGQTNAVHNRRVIEYEPARTLSGKLLIKGNQACHSEHGKDYSRASLA